MTEQLPKGYSPRLYNQDLGPLPQKWNWYNIFAFWMSDVHSVGGYVFAASLFALGLASWQVLIALLGGICIVQLIANLVAKPSQQAAVPYPVICRLAFGVFGANIPAVIRGLIAVAWYGIQTYLASSALIIVVLRFFPSDGGVRRTAFRRSVLPGLVRFPQPVVRCRRWCSGPAWSRSAALSIGRGRWCMRVMFMPWPAGLSGRPAGANISFHPRRKSPCRAGKRSAK